MSFWSIIVLISLSFGCISQPEEFVFECRIANESSSQVKILLHLRADISPYDSVFIDSGEIASIGTYNSPAWASYACDARKIQFIFENGKGYICSMNDISLNDSELCFLAGKDPFLAPRLPNEGLGSVTTITQEDFENAFDL